MLTGRVHKSVASVIAVAVVSWSVPVTVSSATAAPSHVQTISVETGFRVNRDGFSFANWSGLSKATAMSKKHMFQLLEKFLQRYRLKPRLLADVMALQRRYLIAYGEINTYPSTLQLGHNIWEYITTDQDLVTAPVEYVLDFPEDKSMSFARFLELFYFARRRNFGKATVERLA